MKKFDTGDIVFYKKNGVEYKCVVISYISNSVFDRTYTIRTLESSVVNKKFVTKSGNLKSPNEKRKKAIDKLLDEGKSSYT